MNPNRNNNRNNLCLRGCNVKTKRLFGKRLTAVTPQPRELSQPAGCTNTTWEEDQFPSVRHRDYSHGRRRIRRTLSPMKRHATVFLTRREPNDEPINPDVIYGPYARYPRRLDDLVCVGPEPRNLRPFPTVFDTSSGPNLIRKCALFDG